VWVGPQASIAATCELMKAHRFISLPVYDEEKRCILGIADILDICSYLCWGTVHFFEHTSDASVEASELELKAKMSEVPIVEVLLKQQQEHRGRGSLVVKRHLDSVCSLLDQMAQGLHRALVRVWPEDEDEEGQRLEHYRLVAQSDVVRFLVEHRRNLNHHLINSSVSALGLAGPEPASTSTAHTPSSASKSAVKSLIYSIEEGKTALEAFRALAVSGVHAIGIVGSGSLGGGGDGQRLLYNLSASDLRGITPDTVHLLREPVEVFLTRVQESDPTRPKNLVTCSPDTTLIEVMKLVLRSRVHRVWVLDHQRPVGLITLTDILSKFASFDYARAYAAGTKNIVPLSLSSPH
jgi:CBS domain-containing protein